MDLFFTVPKSSMSKIETLKDLMPVRSIFCAFTWQKRRKQTPSSSFYEGISPIYQDSTCMI